MPAPPDGVTSASLSDALRKIHPHRAHVLDLVTPTPGRVLWGEAITMPFVPLRADVPKGEQDFERWLRAAAGDAPEGKVLVAAAYGAPDAAVAGGVRLAHVEAMRLAGLLTNARLRDFDEVRGYAFAAYCRGETPFAGSAEAMPCGANVPVAIDATTVLPGDFVYADAAGAVVVPAADAERAIALARETEAGDRERVAKALGAKRAV